MEDLEIKEFGGFTFTRIGQTDLWVTDMHDIGWTKDIAVLRHLPYKSYKDYNEPLEKYAGLDGEVFKIGQDYYRRDAVKVFRNEGQIMYSPGKPLVINAGDEYILIAANISEDIVLPDLEYYFLNLNVKYLNPTLFTKSEMLAVILSDSRESEKKFAKKYLLRLEDPRIFEMIDAHIKHESRLGFGFCYYCSRYFTFGGDKRHFKHHRIHRMKLDPPEKFGKKFNRFYKLFKMRIQGEIPKSVNNKTGVA